MLRIPSSMEANTASLTSRSGSGFMFLGSAASHNADIMWILASLHIMTCSSSSCRSPSGMGPRSGAGVKSATLTQAPPNLGPGFTGILVIVSGAANSFPGMWMMRNLQLRALDYLYFPMLLLTLLGLQVCDLCRQLICHIPVCSASYCAEH